MLLQQSETAHLIRPAGPPRGSMCWGTLLTVMAVFLAQTQRAEASKLLLVPSSITVTAGDTFSVDVMIEGLGNHTAPSLAVFNFNIVYPNIAGFNSVSFGDPKFGDQLDLSSFGTLSSATNGSGSVSLFELSFDDPDTLVTMQVGAFRLATVSFTAIGLGVGLFSLTEVVLGDEIGNPLIPDSISGTSVTVTGAAPEPYTFILALPAIATLLRGKFRGKY